MTTNANKHGLRAAATARRKRHAQTTPLPPRAGVVEAAREPIAEAPSSNGEAGPADTRSPVKARAFADKAEAAGWQVAIGLIGGATELTATRGPEVIVQAWKNGVWDYAVSFYAHADRSTKPRNASGAAKLLVRSPEDAAAEAGKVASNKHFRKAEPKDITIKLEEAQQRLPFSLDDADELVTGILAGQALVWYNRLSRGTESAIVGRKGVRLSVAPDGERIATFCCPVTGYRSCRLSSILKVGRGRAAKGNDVALVEVG